MLEPVDVPAGAETYPPVGVLVLIATTANHAPHSQPRTEAAACYWNGAMWFNAGGQALPMWGAVVAWQPLPVPPQVMT